MTNEIRQFTDEQIKEVFRKTPKTANLEIHDIEYCHYDLFPDAYIVRMTDRTQYTYQRRPKYNRGFHNRQYQVTDRIVKMSKKW